MTVLEFLKKVLKIGEAKAHAKMNKVEDPIKIAEQNINDLKRELTESMRGLAEVKALYIRTKRESETQVRFAAEYENKAILLLQKAQTGEMNAVDADRLAMQALTKKEEIVKKVQQGAAGLSNLEGMVKKLEENTLQLRTQIDAWDGEIKTLKARARVSEATKNLHQKLNDAGGAGLLMDNIRDKVNEQEFLAESMNALNSGRTSLDDEIDRALGIPTGKNEYTVKASETLEKLKNQMQLNPNVNQSAKSELEDLKAKLNNNKLDE